MTGSGNLQSNKPTPPRTRANSPRKPLQVIHISRKDNQKDQIDEAGNRPKESNSDNGANQNNTKVISSPFRESSDNPKPLKEDLDPDQGLTMADLLGP